MTDNPNPRGAWAGSVTIERRAWVRYACDLPSACQPATAGGERSWAGRVENISRGGIRVVVGRRFEPGTLLQMSLDTEQEEAAQRVLARVIHVTPLSRLGMWALGCAFHHEMSEDALHTLLGPGDPVVE
jgi:hypothetical protein